MAGRHELKYYINYSDYMQLKSRLKHVARPDENADGIGGYKIRSLYFDNYSDKAVFEKLMGLRPKVVVDYIRACLVPSQNQRYLL